MLIGSLLPILVGLPSGWFWSTFNCPLRVSLQIGSAALGFAILPRIDRARKEHCVTHNFLGCDKITGIASDKILNSKFDL